MDRPGPSVSVIVSTANRAAFHVERLVQSLRDQPYRPLEVVLVVGPCPEDMRCLAESLDDVKVQFITDLNLSRSRNTGIAMASGDILAFIDDDAVPHELWLHEVVAAFLQERPDCAGIGGQTIHANAKPHPVVQNRNALVHERGATHDCVRLEPGHENDPTGPWFNRLHGCNMAFRREAIEQVGGFDESFIYHHEETDLCVRLIRAGFRIVHHPRACVDHYPAGSHFRLSPYHVSYYNILRSYTYFSLKHSRGSFLSIAARSFVSHLAYIKRFAEWTVRRRISPRDGLDFVRQWICGYARGIQLGWDHRRSRARTAARPAAPRREFHSLMTVPRKSLPSLDPSRPLKIALLCGELGGPSPGGISVYTEHLAEGLAGLGHEVVIFRSGYGTGNAKPRGYRVVGVVPGPDQPFSMRVLEKLCDEGTPYPFDIVESPLWNGEGAAVGISEIAPLVVRLETPLEVVRRTSGLPLSSEMIHGIAQERLALSYAAGVLAISQAIVDTIEDVYDTTLANHGRLSAVVPIGLPEVKPVAVDLPDELPRSGSVFLFVGRLEARKGILDLGRAFLTVARADSTVQLWIIGSDNSAADGHFARTGLNYEQSLQSIWGPEVSTRVRFWGQVSDELKASLMARCQVFVAPSLYESFGIVFLEAMRAARPVIATRVGGIPEIVVDRETGLLVPTADHEALATAMARMASDPELRDRMGCAGLSRFRQHFSMDAFARRSVDFYREVIARRKGCRVESHHGDASALKQDEAA